VDVTGEIASHLVAVDPDHRIEPKADTFCDGDRCTIGRIADDVDVVKLQAVNSVSVYRIGCFGGVAVTPELRCQAPTQIGAHFHGSKSAETNEGAVRQAYRVAGNSGLPVLLHAGS